MNANTEATEGTVSFRGYKVWYKVVGTGQEAGLPLLCLHGGPGAPHDYLEPLETLGNTGRRIIFYDQLGCGNSDHPHDPAMWTVDLFVDEISTIRKSLGLSRVHLLGHSWGGMLAVEYVLTRPKGLSSLILASTPASIPKYIEGARGLVDALPPDVRQAILKHEDAGTTDDPAYQEAVIEFYRRHLCRVEPWPEYFMRAFTKLMQNPEVYHTMWGPSEFCAAGLLKDWDRVERLNEVRLPTLITSGRHDEVTPASIESLYRGIEGARWEIFQASSHMSHIEEPERYIQVLNGFLREIETRV